MPNYDDSSLASLYTASTIAADPTPEAPGRRAVPRTLPRTTGAAAASGYAAKGAPLPASAWTASPATASDQSPATASDQSPATASDQLLEPDARKTKIDQLEGRLGDWLQNVHTAITGARIEVATETEEGGEWLTDMLFALVAGGVMPGILSLAVAAIGKLGATLAVSGTMKIRQRIAAGEAFDKMFEANEENLKSLLEKGTEPLVDSAKEHAKEKQTEAEAEKHKRKQRGKDRFLEAIASRATLAKEALYEQLPSLNDVDLVCLHEAYDNHHHSVGRYRSFLEQLLSRYDANRIDELGQRQRDGRDVNHLGERVLRAVKVTAFGKTRTALVAQSFYVKLRPSDWGDGPPPMDAAHSDIVRDGLPRFDRWVDGDFASLAQARSAAGEKATFKDYFSTEIWPAGDVYDVTDGWSELDPDDKTELMMWRDDCQAVAAGAQPSMQLDDTVRDPAKAFLTAQGDDTEGDSEGGGE